MKKLLLLSLMGVMACSKVSQTSTDAGCTEASCSIHVEAGATINDIITEDNWQFTLPGSGWVPIQSPDDNIKIILVNQELGFIVFFAKEPTTDTYPDYIIDALRDFKSGGMAIASAKQVSVGGKNFLAITANGNDHTIWAWITMQNGFGYVFSCAAEGVLPDVSTNWFKLCNGIANTVELH